MNRPTHAKPLAALILIIALIAPFIAVSLPKAHAVAGASPPQPVNVLRAFAPFWRIGNGYSSALIVRNTSQQLSASATPIVFTTDARPTLLPAVQLAPGEVKRIYLEEVLPAAHSSAQTGALAIQIDQSQSHNVIGEVVVTNYQQGILFDIPLHAGYAGSENKILHASWWLPDDKTEGTLVLFNASERDIVAHPSIKTNFSQHSFGDVSLSPHESKRLRQTEDRNADTGSISISYDGPPQALLPTLLLFNTKNGFSFTGRFFPKHLQQPNLASRVNWFYPIVVNSKADASLGFLKESKFTAYALISNPSSSTITPQLTATFTAETGATQASSLVVNPLPPGTSSLVDLSELARQSMPNSVSSFSLQVSHEGTIGDLAIDVFSVDHKKDFVFSSEGTAQLGSRLDSIYWNIADDLQSMLVIQNAGDNSIEAQATLNYDTSDGRHEKYKLPLLLVPAKGTRIVNLKQIITAGQPDETGKVIPPGTTFGTVTIEPAAGQQSDMLVGGSFTFDPDAGTCGGDVLPICSREDQEFGLCDLLPILIICEFLCGPADLPQIESISPDRALIGQPVDVLIQGSAFGNNPTLQVDSGITVNITSSSDTQINARFNVSNVSTNGGFHSVFVQNAHGISNGVSFFVQVPTTLFLRAPAFALPPGGPGGCTQFGVHVAVSYQVLDQLLTPLRSAQMEPKETLTNFFVNGIPQPDIPELRNIGPTDVPGTSRFTDAIGGFLDAPVGACYPFANTVTGTQQIFIVAGGIPYLTRVNQFSGSSSAVGTGTLTNGFDIEASR